MGCKSTHSQFLTGPKLTRCRFLWVNLQLQAICLENDDTIHDALDNLPKSLPEIFHRILQHTQTSHKRYQMSTLQILAAAFRPLTTSEFAEAVGLASGSAATPSRLQSHQLGHVRGILSSCGSLVIIDEQDLTVHLVHQSVRQFLLGEMDNAQDYREWQFSANASHLHMANLTMRYLAERSERMDIVKIESGVPPSATPQSSPVFLPNPVAIQRAAQAEIGSGKLSKLLNIASKAKLNGAAATVDITRTAEQLWPGMLKGPLAESQTQMSDLPAMDLLAYARRFWMLHSAPMTEDDRPVYLLWSKVYTRSGTKHWLKWDTPYEASHGVPETMLWAIVHSHNVLLETVLRKQKKRLRLRRGCLKALFKMSPLPHLSPLMAARFLTLQLFLQRGAMSNTQVMLNMRPDFRYSNYACLYAAVFARDYHATRAILCAIGDRAKDLPYPLVELSVSYTDVHMTHLLLSHEVRPLPCSQVQEPALALVMSRLRPGCDPSSILIASWLLKSCESTERCSSNHLASAVATFKGITNKRDFDPARFICVPAQGWLIYHALRAARHVAPWLPWFFTLKGLSIYAAVIAFLYVQTESVAMRVLTFVGVMLIGSVGLCWSRSLLDPKKDSEPPKAFPPALRSIAVIRFTSSRGPWHLTGTTDQGWKWSTAKSPLEGSEVGQEND